MTRYQFGAVLNKAIHLIKLPMANFKQHLFRIGAASWLASKGMSHQVIKKWVDGSPIHF